MLAELLHRVGFCGSFFITISAAIDYSAVKVGVAALKRIKKTMVVKNLDIRKMESRIKEVLDSKLIFQDSLIFNDYQGFIKKCVSLIEGFF